MELQGFPLIKDPEQNFWYGGSQEWYRKRFGRLAGCGPTCAANLAAFYGVGTRPDMGLLDASPLYSKDHYLSLMDRTYQYVKPGMMGFPWRDKFQEKFLRYAFDNGVSFSTDYVEGWSEIETPLNFIRSELNAGRPLALLILVHTEITLDDETWHWMALTGYIPEAGKILVSTYGRRKYLDAGLVFRPHKKNDVHLISFHKES